MGCKPHTISLYFQYQVTSYPTIGIIETYHIPGQPIPPFHSCHSVFGVLFTKYKKYFCRLQYWSIMLHFLWTSSLDFFWHFKLQVEAIGWTLSFENQLNCTLSQLLAICTLNLAIYTLHKPLKIAYLARPFNFSPKQWKTLLIAKGWILAKLLP